MSNSENQIKPSEISYYKKKNSTRKGAVPDFNEIGAGTPISQGLKAGAYYTLLCLKHQFRYFKDIEQECKEYDDCFRKFATYDEAEKAWIKNLGELRIARVKYDVITDRPVYIRGSKQPRTYKPKKKQRRTIELY